MTDDHKENPDTPSGRMKRRDFLGFVGATAVVGWVGGYKTEQDRQFIEAFGQILHTHQPLAQVMLGKTPQDAKDHDAIDRLILSNRDILSYGNDDGIPRRMGTTLIIPANGDGTTEESAHHRIRGILGSGVIEGVRGSDFRLVHDIPTQREAKNHLAHLRKTWDPRKALERAADIVQHGQVRSRSTFTLVGFEQPDVISLRMHNKGMTLQADHDHPIGLRCMPVIFQSSPASPLRIRFEPPTSRHHPESVFIAGDDITLDLTRMPQEFLLKKEFNSSKLPYITTSAGGKVRYEFSAAQFHGLDDSNIHAFMELLLNTNWKHYGAERTTSDITIRMQGLPELHLAKGELIGKHSYDFYLDGGQPQPFDLNFTDKIKDWLTQLEQQAAITDPTRDNPRHARRELMDKLEPKPRGR